MKKIFILLIVLLTVFIFNPKVIDSASNPNEYIVSNFSELSTALAKTNNTQMTYIIINGSINLEQDITVKGKVSFVGSGNSELVFENNDKKRTLYNAKNSELVFENLTISRMVVDETEGFLFRFEQSNVYFNECIFEVACLPDGASLTYDRITYCPTGTDLTLYFNNCVYNTEAYFYRGTMVFFNNEMMPSTGGSPTIKNFNELKIDYETKTITYPSSMKVSEDESFTKILKSGSEFKSLTTYYVTKDNFTFSFTTKNLKLATPTLASVNIDYEKEVITFTEQYLVSLDENFTNLVNSGDKVTPGMTLYIKELGQGIFMDSDACVATLPERPNPVQLECDFVCSFGFVMQYYENVEFKIDGEYQLSPVFIDLKSDTTYQVSMRLKATDSSFASRTYEISVKTTK